MVLLNVFQRKRLQLTKGELCLLLGLCLVLLLVFCVVFSTLASLLEEGGGISYFLYRLTLGGFTLYGGVFGIILGCIIFAAVRKRPPRDVLDYFAPSIPLAFGFARTGCLFYGCCYGIESSFGIPNVHFPGKLLFPTQPLEILVNFLLFALILVMRKLRGKDRYSLEIYLLGYAVGRFFIEYFRAEKSRGFLPFGLTFSQDISILLVCFVAAEAVVLLIRRGKLEEEKLKRGRSNNEY